MVRLSVGNMAGAIGLVEAVPSLTQVRLKSMQKGSLKGMLQMCPRMDFL